MPTVLNQYKATDGQTIISASLQRWDGDDGEVVALQNEQAENFRRPGIAKYFTQPVIAGIFEALGCAIGDRYVFPMDKQKVQEEWKLL